MYESDFPSIAVKDVRKGTTLTRVQVANLMGVHRDTVSHLLSEGLGWAVLFWGGSSKPMRFSRPLTEFFQAAWSCRRDAGHRCGRCRCMLDDAKVVATHLIEARHGYLDTCGVVDCGQHPGRIGGPCH
jgi:hypothetical protein